MFLKTLSIKGFKSFADPCALEMEPGVTVVVGPNGSGKSNVVDAIAWVLGAQAPSAVRSQKMDDVIFAGTAKRAALGRAEVGLTIDNSAGLLNIDFAEVTITRTLFRSGDSEYAINGVPCRLLDIQEFLSDSGVGRQQHVIISQGQIDAVLNARPEDRRLVIEEAAGVLKYRRRKEKAERRLSATEANLARIQDLLREVRRQLRPLERQAEAARRYDGLIAELKELRIHVAGREIAGLQSRLETVHRRVAELAGQESETKGNLAQLDTAVLATEAQLSALGGDDLGDALVRFESLRERARGLVAVLTQRRRAIDAERSRFVDAAVIASLEADAARAETELADVDDRAARLAPDVEELSAAEAELAAAREAFQAEWGAGVPAPSGQAAETRGELAALKAGLDRGSAERTRTAQRLDNLRQKADRLAGEAGRLAEQHTEVDGAGAGLAAEVAQAARRREVAEATLTAAEADLRDAASERSSWAARAQALAQALDGARARAGAERLAGVDGVLGTLLDCVEIDEGWETAFEAAAGEALAAVVVDGVAAGRRALETLRAGDLAGAVLPLGAGAAPPVPVEAGEALRRHVRSSRPDVEALLDALVGNAVVVAGGWQAALDVALAHPAAVVVTPDGDRFGTSGWRVGGTTAGATGAALEEARARADAATAAHTEAEAVAVAARAEAAEARRAEATASKAVGDNTRRTEVAADGLRRLQRERGEAAAEIESLSGHIGELTARVERDQARVAELADLLPQLEAEETEALRQARAMTEARSRLEERAGAVATLRTDIEVRAAGLEERRSVLRQRLAEVEERLSHNVAERQAAEVRRVELDATQAAVDRLAALVGDRLTVVEAELQVLRERRKAQSDAAREVAADLDRLRKQRGAAERSLEEQREHARRADLERTELQLRLEGAVEALRRDLDCEPGVAKATECPPLPDATNPQARVRDLERELRLMGPVNPLALQEYEALEERHQLIQDQLDDVKATRRELAKVIRAIDTEIVNVFAAAYADVAQNFEALFETLFPGGRGRLTLTDPENLLTTGIEVEAKPSGKNVRKLSLLSGGERSLTALAFLFAVFRSRPSPFYVMDEVEAALDDVNLHRFLDLVAEFRKEAQLIIVSHQKRTMEAADCLYGVTMQPGGSSRVVSERVTSLAS